MQHSRKNKQKRYILSFAKSCPFVRHKFHRTNLEGKRKIKFFCPAAKRRSNLRGRAGIKDKLYFSRSLARLCGINSTAQTQRKKENKVLLSGGEAPQQFTRASRHKRQIVFFAKPCPFVRHKFHRTNSGKKKIKFFCPAFLRKKSGCGRGRVALVALRRGRKTLFVLKAQERVNFLAAKRLKKRENPRRGFSLKSNNYFFVT